MKHICKHCRADVCEFCGTSYNEEKTERCYTCECGREGRNHPKETTMREDCKGNAGRLIRMGLSGRTDGFGKRF